MGAAPIREREVLIDGASTKKPVKLTSHDTGPDYVDVVRRWIHGNRSLADSVAPYPSRPSYPSGPS
jgi:hypothetical protein